MTEPPAGGVDWLTAGRPVTPGTAARGTGTPPDGRTPVRTCVGCRGKGGRADLVRVVLVDGLLVPDLRARAAGRGAWLHPDPGCLDLAVRRRALPRALRVPGPLDTTAVRAELERLAAAASGPHDRPDQHDPAPRREHGSTTNGLAADVHRPPTDREQRRT